MPTSAIQNGRPAADCPPAPVRVTKSLLGYGVIAGPFYVAASLAEALTRSGFSLAHNDWSLLANGALGWIHVLVLVLTGLMVAAAAAGAVRQRRAERVTAASGWLLGVYAVGLVGAGFFIADPADGFPAGTPAGPTVNPSWHGTLHIVFGGIGFLGLITACLVLAWQFCGLRQLSWALFSLTTGVLFFAAFAGIATGGAASSAGVLAFTGGVILAWTWLALLSAHLYRRAAAWPAASVTIHGRNGRPTMEFTTTLLLGGKTATGIRVPDEVVAALGGGKRIPVSVTINGTRYVSTIATMRGEPMIPVSADMRSSARIAAGDSITVKLERDDAPRTVDIPADLADALRADPATSDRFAALSYSNQRRHVLSITGARTIETRTRRIQRVLDELRTP